MDADPLITDRKTFEEYTSFSEAHHQSQQSDPPKLHLSLPLLSSKSSFVRKAMQEEEGVGVHLLCLSEVSLREISLLLS